MIKKDIDRLLGDMKKLEADDSESYLKFAKSRQDQNKAQMKLNFTRIIAIHMKVMEQAQADYAFFWIKQLLTNPPKQMYPHFKVASELLMGSIRGTAHVAKANIQEIKVPEKRQNYLNKINKLLEVYQNKYEDLIAQLN